MSGSVSQIYVVDDDLLVRESVGRRVWPEDKDLQVQIEEGENMNEHLPRVVIVGGGFGGLAAAKALRWSPVEVLLIDRANHHLFQPLLYQVATSVLAPGQISSPIRGILRKQSNATVVMGEVTGIDKDQRCVLVSS